MYTFTKQTLNLKKWSASKLKHIVGSYKAIN